MNKPIGVLEAGLKNKYEDEIHVTIMVNRKHHGDSQGKTFFFKSMDLAICYLWNRYALSD